MKTLVILCAVVVSSLAARLNIQVRASSCPNANYQTLGQMKGKTHTMCKYPSVVTGGVSSNDIRVILQKHNSLRSNPVSASAKAMNKLVWDPKVAEIAQHYADSCPNGHDKLRDVPGYGVYTGQNLAYGQKSWEQAIQDWFDEVDNFAYGTGSNNGGEVGHYTQVVNDRTARIGCGYADGCGGKYGNIYVCNYMIGQMNDDTRTPFTKGSTCSGCQTCNNGLCDCMGKECYNMGTLDTSTCTCSCAKPYTGENCEILECPASDPSYCGTQWPSSYCQTMSNVPGECPIMCGLCSNTQTGGSNYIAVPAVTVTLENGSTKAYGAGSVRAKSGGSSSSPSSKSKAGGCTDKYGCGSQLSSSYCDTNMVVTGGDGNKYSMKEYCPAMCGAC